MITKLFSMHNIKYIISVDDCFLPKNRQDMAIMVCSEMCESLDPFQDILSSSSQAEHAAEIRDAMNLGIDVSELIQSLVERLEGEALCKCYEICEKSAITYTEERDSILSFLDSLKNAGQIIDYKTFFSTSEANSFYEKKAGMTEGAILWLLDRNFSRIGESADAGLHFAENLVQRADDINRYIYILSSVDTDSQQNEDEIEMEFDRILTEKCHAESHSFIYYINKQRILNQNSDKFAKSLAQGFKRKVCYELFQLFSDSLQDALSESTTKIQSVRQKTLNSLFTNKVYNNGESYIDFAGRFVQIFYNDEYNKTIAQKYNNIAAKAKHFERLCANNPADNNCDSTNILKEYRKIELYNQHINAQHCEIATGDIFEIQGSFYLLVSQSCDIYLRSNGERKLEEATLLEICDLNKKIENSYSLSCFSTMEKPAVVYHSLKILPFEILDLCTLNDSGQSKILISDFADIERKLELYTANYKNVCVKYLID